jgi:hypothetical protein
MSSLNDQCREIHRGVSRELGQLYLALLDSTPGTEPTKQDPWSDGSYCDGKVAVSMKITAPDQALMVLVGIGVPGKTTISDPSAWRAKPGYPEGRIIGERLINYLAEKDPDLAKYTGHVQYLKDHLKRQPHLIMEWLVGPGHSEKLAAMLALQDTRT